MSILMLISIFWIVYGIMGFLGIQAIPKQFKGTEIERKYKRFRGSIWLMIGLPWFVVELIIMFSGIYIARQTEAIILFIVAIPSFVFDYKKGKEFRQ